MAEWKKVIVSGSAAVLSQLNVGTNQQITTSQATTFLTGSFTGSFFGNGSNLTGLAATAGTVSSSILAAGSGQGSTTLTTNGVSSGDVTATGLGTAGTPTFAGLTISTNAVAINNTNGITTNAATFPIANSTATTINLGGSATTINIGASTGTTTVNNNLSVLGTLYVQGSVTAISSSNLYVADQFILLASGSANNTDGGIVIDRGAYANGNIAYGFDSTTGRWGFQNGLVDTTNTLDPTFGGNGISGSFAGIVFTEAAHSATKPTTGEFAQAGAIYTNTDGTIWMYA
jgi:hypothetical protein